MTELSWYSDQQAPTGTPADRPLLLVTSTGPSTFCRRGSCRWCLSTPCVVHSTSRSSCHKSITAYCSFSGLCGPNHQQRQQELHTPSSRLTVVRLSGIWRVALDMVSWRVHLYWCVPPRWCLDVKMYSFRRWTQRAEYFCHVLVNWYSHHSNVKQNPLNNIISA
jgi:hypothetical protein